MNMTAMDRLNEIVESVSDVLEEARANALGDTAALLAMARLDLLMRAHGISDKELRAFCTLLERGLARAEQPPAPGKAAEPQRESPAKAATSAKLSIVETGGATIIGARNDFVQARPSALASLRNLAERRARGKRRR